MILFWVIAAAMAAAALAFLLPPLLRRRTAAPDVRVAANAAVYREQLEELGAELQRGAITQAEFERASREVERRIVAEHAAGAPEPALHRPPRAAAIAVAVLLPVLAGVGYWQLGNPVALDATLLAAAGNAAKGHDVTPEQMAALVEKLAARMEQTPDDAEGWVLLGRSRTSLGQYDKAAAAYAKAAQLMPKDADLLADYADALAMAQGRTLEGEPSALIKRALAIDPNHVKSLALAGSAEFDRKNYRAAIGYWERVLKVLPADSPFARSVTGSIEEARALSGQPPLAKSTAKPAAQAKSGARVDAQPVAKAGGALSGTVSLDPAVAAKAAPGDTVFILARPANGPRMPLAVTRITVAQLPYRFTLDDSMAMSAGATISSQAQVVVVARVSKAGSPAPQKGDIEGTSAAVAPGAAGLNVVLQRVVD